MPKSESKPRSRYDVPTHPARYIERFITPQDDLTDENCATDQHGANAADINKIVERFNTSGVLPLGNTMPPRFEYAPDQTFAEAARIVAQAKSTFEEFPDYVKKKFNNNPTAFIEALYDPDQAKALQDVGLIPKTPEIDSQTREIIESTPPQTPADASQPEKHNKEEST